ncbi:MAG: 4Fe-4S binding protein [Desulfurococcaceae archaeon]
MSKGNILKPLKLIIVAGKTGRVTVKYPFEEPLVSPEFRGLIKINAEKCIGCGACVNACPPNALEMIESEDKKILKYYAGRCIFCWRCVDVCPVKAIEGTKEFELATNDPIDLHSYTIHTRVKCSTCGQPAETVRMRNYVLSRAIVAENYAEECSSCRKNSFIKALSIRKAGFYEE